MMVFIKHLPIKITLELKTNLNILEKDAIDYLVIINKREPNEVKDTFIKPNKKYLFNVPCYVQTIKLYKKRFL